MFFFSALPTEASSFQIPQRLNEQSQQKGLSAGVCVCARGGSWWAWLVKCSKICGFLLDFFFSTCWLAFGDTCSFDL